MKHFLWLTLFTSTLVSAAPSKSSIKWTPCPSPLPEALLCGQLQVPLDYADKKGKKITIGLTKVSATNPKKRIGNLFYSPGGPGAAPSHYLSWQALGLPFFSNDLATHFDIMGMDPRGVGLSTPVQCDPKTWNTPVSLFPADEAELYNLVAQNKAMWKSCLDATGPLLGHVDTTSMVRDMEEVRKALGGEKLNYFGQSYGTQVGYQYAELFPLNYRTLALDAMFDHSIAKTQITVDESETYETELKAFFAWCDTNNSCALHGQNAIDIFLALIANATTSPIPAPACASSGGCSPLVSASDILRHTQDALLIKDPIPAGDITGWAGLSIALAEAAAGNATTLSTPLAQSTSDPSYADLAITCNDWQAADNNYDALLYRMQVANFTTPLTRGAAQMWEAQVRCIGWPVKVANPTRKHIVQNSKNLEVLMVHSTRDPSCNPTWALGVAEQIEKHVMVWRDGDGHTSYILNGTVRAVIDDYLVNKTLPKAGTVYSS